MSELTLKANVTRMLKRDFPAAWVWKISDKFYSGIPDLLILLNGRSLFIELKDVKGTTTKLQEYTIAEIRKRGIEAHVARSVKEVKQILEKGGNAYANNQ